MSNQLAWTMVIAELLVTKSAIAAPVLPRYETSAQGVQIEKVADISVSYNYGNCTVVPPNWSLIKKSGVFFYEFCDYPVLKNHVWIDVHNAPTLLGDFGNPVTKYYRPCSTWPAPPPPPADQSFLPDLARTLYCKDP